MRKNSNKIRMYRIIILSYMYLERCSLPEKKRWNWCTCFGNFLLFTFKLSQPSLLGWHVCMSTFVIRMKNLKIMWLYFMKYCLTSKVQKLRNLWTLIQSFGVKFLYGRFFFYNDLRTYFTDQDYRSHKLIARWVYNLQL